MSNPNETYQKAYDAACNIVKDFGYCTKCDRTQPCAAAKTGIECILKEFVQSHTKCKANFDSCSGGFDYANSELRERL